MTNHPYPNNVRQAVAKTIGQQILVMREWDDLNDETKHAFLTDADQVLQALWDASRIDTIQQLKKVPDFSILVDNEGFEYKAYEIRNPNIFPAHVLYWGDANGA